jgi:hypothetical protein
MYAPIYYSDGKNLLSRLAITSDGFRPNTELVYFCYSLPQKLVAHERSCQYTPATFSR